MAITYSTNLRLTLIGTGDQAGTWGNTTNTNLGTLIEQAIAGFVSQTVSDSAGSPTSLTISDGTSSVARNMIIALDGALSAPRDVILPTNKKLYFIHNNTTGGHAVTVKCAGQTGVAVPAGAKALLACNGTDIINAANYFSTFIFPSSATITTLTGTTLGYSSASITTASIGSGTVSNLLATTISAGSASITNLSSVSGTVSGNFNMATASGNVGIGTTSPAAFLHLYKNSSTEQASLRLQNASTAVGSYATVLLDAGDVAFQLYSDAGGGTGTPGTVLRTTSNHTLMFGTNGAERMRISADGKVGIGTTSPVSKLDVAGIVTIKDNPAATAGTTIESTNTGDTIFKQYYGGIMAFGTNNAEDMRLSSRNLLMTGGGDVRASIFYDYANTGCYLDPANTGTSMVVAGNVGIGVTPSAWAGLTAIQIPNYGTISSSGDTTWHGSNFYYDGNFKYVSNGYATQFAQAGGSFQWWGAVSGTAGATISFANLMSLYGSGELVVGGPVGAASFYDIDNTAYYLDPANTGTSMAVAGSITAGRTAASYKLDVLSSDFIVSRFQSTYTVGGKNYTAVLIGGQSPAAGASVGWVQDAVTPANSFFHVTPYASSEGGVFCITEAKNVGIGTTSPAALLHLYKNSSTEQASLRLQNASTAVGSYATVLLDAGAVTSQLYSDAGGGTGTQGTVLRTTSNHPLMFGTNGTERMRLDSAGNLGLGVTPSNSNLPTFESQYGLFVGQDQTNIVVNGYYNSGYLYKATAAASRYQQITGQHFWYTAPSGTAGNAINFTQAMTLDASGNLQVVGTSDATAFRDISNTAYYLDPANTGTSLNVAGSVVAAGNVTAYSDIRVKANIEPIHGALDKISQINGVTYTRTDLDDKERRYGGVIAQEIEAVLPEAVFDNGDKKAVDYNATIGLLIEAVKEQQAQILELKLEIQQLKGN